MNNRDRYKFRFWDLDDLEMLEDEAADGFYLNSEGEIYEFRLGGPRKCLYLIPLQCADMRDVGGKLIYEGDIVKDVNSDHWQVYWNSKAINMVFLRRICFKDLWRNDAKEKKDIGNYLEVVGNIFERKEEMMKLIEIFKEGSDEI